MAGRTNSIEPGRPHEASLQTRESNLHLSHSGKNKSVWQSFIDSSGFAKRHPDLSQQGSSDSDIREVCPSCLEER